MRENPTKTIRFVGKSEIIECVTIQISREGHSCKTITNTEIRNLSNYEIIN